MTLCLKVQLFLANPVYIPVPVCLFLTVCVFATTNGVDLFQSQKLVMQLAPVILACAIRYICAVDCGRKASLQYYNIGVCYVLKLFIFLQITFSV